MLSYGCIGRNEKFLHEKGGWKEGRVTFEMGGIEEIQSRLWFGW